MTQKNVHEIKLPVYYTTADIAEMFNCGLKQAQKYVREIKRCSTADGKGKLKRGQVLDTELDLWMHKRYVSGHPLT